MTVTASESAAPAKLLYTVIFHVYRMRLNNRKKSKSQSLRARSRVSHARRFRFPQRVIAGISELSAR